MNKFTLPETLPGDVTELKSLATAASAWFDALKAKHVSGETLSDDEMADLRTVVADMAALATATSDAEAAETARAGEIDDLLTRGEPVVEESPTAEEQAAADAQAAAEAAVVTEAEVATAAAAEAEAEAILAAAKTQAASIIAAAAAGKAPARSTKFAGIGAGKVPAKPDSVRTTPDAGWRMEPGSFGFQPGLVGFDVLGAALDNIRGGHRVRSNRPITGAWGNSTFATMTRDVKAVDDPHELYRFIESATDQSTLPGGSLTAAGGWCAPSETLYDFCAVPSATDLISLPEITIRRGGVRWPVEPDLTSIFESFEWFFTETELEAVDMSGDPTAIKECVEIPCPDDFEEIRLNAVGYCVEAGILQTQGWPELITWFLQKLTAEHFRALSRRTILDIVSGSGAAKVIPIGSQMAAGSSILNSMALMATNLRLNEGLSRDSTIEFVAPSWQHELVRADLAQQEGMDTKAVTDAQITSWFSARNLAGQFVGDWQTRDSGMPGNLDTLVYPESVDVLMYPAGTWFRSLSNVIELGVQYPKELLQVNRYTRLFTEDAIAVGKRCHESILVRIPICPSGAIGARQQLTCNTASTMQNEVQQVAITGTPTGGTFTLTFDGQTTGNIDFDATAAEVKTALVALSNLTAADLVTAGGVLPGTAVVVTFQGAMAGVPLPQMTADAALLTGGTTPAVVVTTLTQGAS